MKTSIEKLNKSAESMRAGTGWCARYPAEARAWALQYAEAKMERRQSMTTVSS